jgi:hypothetical protein
MAYTARMTDMALPNNPDRAPRSIVARVLVPLAMVAVVLAVVAIVSGTMSDSRGGNGDGERKARAEQQQSQKPEFEGDVYVVQPGDTLTGVAAKTGVSVGELQRLNPELDPETLGTGQSLKIR